MRYRSLGRTGLKVSEIGFGAWGIGGDAGNAIAYGPADHDDSLHALRTALDRGVTFYDTSDFYGHGRSEELIGEAFAGRRGEIIIATKVGMLGNGEDQDFSPRHIRRSVAASLRRLRTDYIDLYQLHSAPPAAIGDATISALESLQRAGTIRAFGLSARSPAEASAVIERFGLACVQVNFNLLDQRAMECGLFELAAREHVGVIVRTPLCFGFLTGHYAASTAFHELDHRRQWSREQIKHWAHAHELFSPLIQAVPGQTPAQFALRYCLSHACVSTTIPGMLTNAHVIENSAAGTMAPMDDAEQAGVADIYSRHTFFIGR